MADRPPYEAEIHDLHDFFEAWMSGSLPDDDASFARAADVLAESFTFIEPNNGAQLTRDQILGSIRAGHGARPGLRIWIEDVRLLHESDDMLVASYVEKQDIGDDQTARRSTVVFRASPSAPNGLLWLHVHETWVS